jgi:hypothetical protein
MMQLRSSRFTFALVLVGTIAAASIAWSAEPRAPMHAREILSDIKVNGANVVVEKLWHGNHEWNDVMAKIATGKQEWLDVAAALRPGTDAGASETLDEAIFLALESAPVAVLKLLDGKPFETDVVCSSNIGTDYSSAKSIRFIRNRIKVLSNVSDPDVKEVRVHCQKNLRAALKDLVGS